MSLFRAVVTVGGLTAVSRVAGFARDILTAAIVGAGPMADAFFVALKLPNLFRRLFAEGAFGVSFVPLFSATLEREGRPAAIRFAEATLAMMIAILAPFTLLAVLTMPWTLTLIAPGFIDDPARYAQAALFARITFPYLLMMSLVALMGGMLNAIGRFAPFAAMPILFNLTLIASLLFLAPRLGNAGLALSWGVLASGVLQLLWMAWACRRAGLSLRLPRPRLTPDMRRLFRLIGPGAIGAGAMQVNLFVDVLIASLLPTGAISFLYYADRLNQLPLGIVGIAIGAALLPPLTRQIAAGKADAAGETQNRALEYGLLFALPAAIALAVIPEPILSVLFERGAFGPAETAATAAALAGYAVGIPAYIMAKVFSTAYFARHDTASPVRAAVAGVVANIILSLALIGWLGHAGIALATGLSGWLTAGLLARGLRRDGSLRPDRRLRRRLPGLLGSALLLAGALDVMSEMLAPIPPGLEGAGPLALLILGGAAVYFSAAIVTGSVRPGDIRALLRRASADKAS